MADKDKQKFYWLKTDKDYFNEYKIRSLLSEKKGDTYCVILQQLKCESLNHKGVLRYSEQRAYKIEELAYVINRPQKLLEEALRVLVEKELLEILDDGTIILFDENVGSATGQTLRKSGKSAVNFTNELPQEYQEDEVFNTLEIRDKRLENRDKSIDIRVIEDDDEIKNINYRFLELGFKEETIERALNIYKHYSINDYKFYQKVINTLVDKDIYDKEAYIAEISRSWI